MLGILFIVLLLLIFLGSPVLLAIGAVASLGIILTPDLVITLFPQKMFTMLDSSSLLALPYFILAGEIMSRGGLSKKLVDFTETVVGHLRAGLGHASVLACMIFANVSGSATASTSAIGSILLPSMKERGYKPGFAGSLLATAGVIGSIIPPSMVMIVYGSMAGVSIGGLFLAGIIPGIIIVIGLMTTTYLHSFSDKFPELQKKSGSFQLKAVLKSLPNVWVALLAPVIILGGILTGIFTATEAGVVACFYSFIVSFFVYKSIKLKDLPKLFVKAAVTTSIVVGIIAVAGSLGWLMTYLDFNEIVRHVLFSITTQPLPLILILVAIMMFLAMFIESLAILVIMIPVIVNIAEIFGFNPYYFGMIMVMATQIGATTPPVAVGLFIATSVAETTYDRVLKYCWPFVLTLIIVLLLIIFIPGLSTWLPNIFLETP
jgi:tripartite ATP-independent transporter DctM subunit